MNEQIKVDHACRMLAHREYKGNVRFRGCGLEHFSVEELRKIVEMTMEQSERELQFYKTACNGFRRLSFARGEEQEHRNDR